MQTGIKGKRSGLAEGDDARVSGDSGYWHSARCRETGTDKQMHVPKQRRQRQKVNERKARRAE
jgi:hypothetical protein